MYKRQPQEPQWLRYPAVSPDGAQIAFSYGGRLYIVPTEGGAARALTTSDVFATRPVWSPDGRTIAFAADRFGNLDVFAMPAMIDIDKIFLEDREHPPSDRTLPWTETRDGITVVVEPKPHWAEDMRVFLSLIHI